MEGITNFSKFGEYGLLGLIIGAVILLLFLVVKWTLSTTKDILKQAAEERKDWHDKIDKVNNSMQQVCNCINKHDEKADERARYVREEHQKMINNLEEQSKVLARINGYKDN